MDINLLLQRKNMSQYALSKNSGVPYSTISDICLGKSDIRKCNVDTAYKIAQALDCSIETLINEEEIAEFDTSIPPITETEYYQSQMKFRKNVILRGESALQYMKCTDGHFSLLIKVYALTDLPYPFIVKKVKNFKNIDYECIDGVLCTTFSKSLDDMISDSESDMQIFDQALSNYYYKNNKSFDGIKISKKNLDFFNREKELALEYYKN